MANQWDLIVVGAGPAGCSLAARVSSEGYRVLLLDKNREEEIGGDWLVDVEASVFDEVGIATPQGEELEPSFDAVELHTFDCAAHLTLETSPCLPVLNRHFVQRLLRDARESGTVLETGARATGPLMAHGAVTGVTYRDSRGRERKARASLVADASGYTGVIRRFTPYEWGFSDSILPTDTVLARREEWEIDPDQARAYMAGTNLKDRIARERTALQGSLSVEFIYLDLERRVVDILVGIKSDPRWPTADQRFEWLKMKYPFMKKRIWGGGSAIPIRRTWDAFVGDGLLILGDAACQVIPLHGSGVASALVAAKLAAESSLKALAEGRYDRATLWDYCARFQRDRGARLAYFHVLRKAIDSLRPDDVKSLIQAGVLMPEDIWNGLALKPFNMEPSELVGRLKRGWGKLPLLLHFGLYVLKAQWTMAAYRYYPETFDATALRRWSAIAANGRKGR